MRQTLVLAAFAAVALMGMSCSPAASDIYPMSVGSVWKMDILFTSVPIIGSTDTIETGTIVTTAVDKATLATGKEVVSYRRDTTVHLRTPDSTWTSTSYAYYREDGDWILGYASLMERQRGRHHLQHVLLVCQRHRLGQVLPRVDVRGLQPHLHRGTHVGHD